MDFSNIRPWDPDRNEIIRQRVSSKVRQLLGDRKVNELSLEEALKLKKLYDLADWRRGGEGAGWGDYHIDSLYELEAAGEFVKALKLAYKRQGKLHGDIEELKLLLTESDQQLHRERAARSRILLGIQFGVDDRGPDIKRLEEGNIMMLEELNQNLEEKRILEQEISKLQLQIKKLKEEYLSSDLPKRMKQVAHEALLSDLAAEAAAKAAAAEAAAEAAAAPARARAAAVAATVAGSGAAEAAAAAEADFAQLLAAEAAELSTAAEAARMAESSPGGLRMRKGANSHSLRRRAQKAKNRAQNAVEQKAVRNLNARESERAATLIFPSQNYTRRKPTWGIPNVGPGFGGSRKAKPMRKRRRSRKN
jgi:hypothetical protein